MADETVSFNFTDAGTVERLTELLRQLGVTGEQALNRLAAAYTPVGDAATRAAAAQDVIAQAVAAGIPATTEFAAGLEKLSAGQLQSAAAGVSGAESIAAYAAACAEAAAANATVAASAAEATEAFTAESASLERLAATLATAAQTFGGIVEGAAAAATELRALDIAATATSAAFSSGAEAATAFRSSQAFVTQEVGQVGIAMTAVRATVGGVQAGYTGLSNFSKALSADTQALSAAFGGLGTALTVAIGGAALAKDIDAATGLERQVKLLGGTLQEQNALFNQIGKAAQESQTPLTTFGNTFGQINAGIQKYGGTAQQALTITTALSNIFYATNTSGAQAARALHDVAEGLAAGQLHGQQLLSLSRQAPAAFNALAAVLGTTSDKLLSLSHSEDSHSDAVANIDAKIAKLSNTQNTGLQSVSHYSDAINSQRSNIQKLSGELNSSVLSDQQKQKVQQQLALATENYNKALPGLSAGLNAAKSAQNDANTAEINALTAKKNSIIATKDQGNALSGLNIFQKLSANGALAYSEALIQQTGDLGTIAGAFTNLNTQFILYLYNTGDADTATKAFKATLGFIGDNLSTIIPLAATFIGILSVAALEGIYTAVKNLQTTTYLLSGAQYALAASSTVLNAALTPEFAAIAAGVIGVLALYAAYGKITGQGDVLTPLFTTLATVVGTFKDAVVGGTKALGDHANAAGAAGNASKALGADANGSTTGINNETAALNRNTAAAKQNADANNAANFGAANRLQIPGATDGGINQPTYSRGLSKTDPEIIQGISKGSSGQYTGAQPSFVDSPSYSPAQFTPTGGGGSLDTFGGDDGQSRNGSAFTVPGSSGVDSKIIRVSPGEHVTIQTPMQRALGVVNNTTPANARFRDGGSIAGASFHAVSGGVTGYGLVNADDYNFTSEGSIYSQQSIDATNAAAASAAAKAAADAALSAAQSAADAASSVADSSANLASANDNYSSSSGGGSSDAFTGTSGGQANPYGGGPTANPYSNKGGNVAVASTGNGYNNASYIAAQAAYTAKVLSFQPTEIGGVSKPSDPSGIGWTPQQSSVWAIINGKIVPSPSGLVPNGNGGTLTPTAYVAVAAKKAAGVPPNQADYKMREGGSFMVPGSTGVDSRVIQMSVSPGEEVNVKTRQQQTEGSAPTNSAGQTVIFNVTTPDADSFRKSSAQISSDFKRKLARTA